MVNPALVRFIMAAAIFLLTSCGQPTSEMHSLPRSSPDMTVLGIRLGAPLELPKCVGFEPGARCAEWPVTNASTEVFIPELQSSDTYESKLSVEWIDGRVEHVIVRLAENGVETAMHDLMQKYGPPSTTAKRNNGGDLVSWNFDNLMVTYSGPTIGGAGNGAISFSTPTAQAALAKRIDQLHAAEPRL